MKKYIFITLVLAAVLAYFYYFNSSDIPSYDEVNIGDSLLIDDESYELTMKEHNIYTYEGDLLVEVLSPDNILYTKVKYFYDGDLLIKEERYKDDRPTLSVHNTYSDGVLVESKTMNGTRLLHTKNIVEESNKKVISFSNSEGLVSTSTVLEDDNGNVLSNEVRNADGKIGFTNVREYENDLLINSTEVQSNGRSSHSTYEYDKNGDLAVQYTTETGEEVEEFVVYYESEHDDAGNLAERKTMVLKKISSESLEE